MLTLHRMQKNASVYYPGLSFASHLCLFLLLLLQATHVKGEVWLSPEGMDTAAAAQERDVNLLQSRQLVQAQLCTLLYWYSGEETVLKRGKNKWLGARSQRNFFNWLFPCIQHILSTVSRGAELEMANSSQACNALIDWTDTHIFLHKSLQHSHVNPFSVLTDLQACLHLDLENTE